MARILVFGDSIAWGAWDVEGGWVQRLRKFLDEKTLSSNFLDYFSIYNLAFSGDTSTDILERLEPEIKARLAEGHEIIILFSIGINDSFYLHDLKSNMVSLDKFKENIKKLIEIAKKFTDKIVFVGLTPIDETKVALIPWDTNKSYKNESIKKYDEIIKEVCQKNKILFIEIFDDWLNSDYKELLEDGAHPNSFGHQKLFETIRDFLIKNKII